MSISGYTNPPSAMTAWQWDLEYLRMACCIAALSKDPSTKVGAVVVSPDRHRVGVGFNRFPDGHPDLPQHYADRTYKYQHILHAEAVALQNFGETANGAVLYTSFPTCPGCTKLAGEAGIARIVSRPLDREGRTPEWVREWEAMLVESLEIANLYRMRVEFRGC